MAAAAAGLAGLVAGCGPHVDVSIPVVTTLARSAVAAKPFNLCNLPPPANPVTGVVPAGRGVLVLGSGFLPQAYDVTADIPRVDVPQVSLHGPADLTLPKQLVSYVGDGTLSVGIPVGNGALPLGLYDVTVKNPEGTAGTLAQALQIVPPPSVTSVAPASICTTQAQRIVLTGGVFSAQVPPAAAVAGVPLAGAGVRVDSTTQLTLTVPANTIPAGASSATIDLTDADGCTLSPSASISVGATCAP